MADTLRETPDLRWFDAYPPCRMCGKPSAGQLMSVRNERYGDHCKRCADKRLKVSAQVQEELAKRRSEGTDNG